MPRTAEGRQAFSRCPVFRQRPVAVPVRPFPVIPEFDQYYLALQSHGARFDD
jgi:hypothetical protein